MTHFYLYEVFIRGEKLGDFYQQKQKASVNFQLQKNMKKHIERTSLAKYESRLWHWGISKLASKDQILKCVSKSKQRTQIIFMLSSWSVSPLDFLPVVEATWFEWEIQMLLMGNLIEESVFILISTGLIVNTRWLLEKLSSAM